MSKNRNSMLHTNNFTQGKIRTCFFETFLHKIFLSRDFPENFLIKDFRNEHLFQAEDPILPKIHEWWKEENFYSTSDGREIINNFGCITRFLINAAKKFTVKNFTGDTQRNPLKIYLNALKIHLTAIHILPHILLNKIHFRKKQTLCQQFDFIVDKIYFRMVTCDNIFSGKKTISVENFSRNSVKSRQLDNTRTNERTRLFHDTAPGKLFFGKTLAPTYF